ncbi:MAG: hypothetical protein J6W86_00890 [Bacteroidales bacterium]|nr:hypothetical protein [Bacteroidales bacterium]
MKRLFIVAMAALLAAACTETKKAEPAYPVGDRAFFEVAGNVESIDFTQETGGELMFLYDKPTFTKEGLFYVKDIKYKETKEGDKTILELDTDEEDGGGEEYIKCDYDSKGRLICLTGWEVGTSEIIYDDQNRIVSYSFYGLMGMESEYKYTFTYDKGINPTSVTIEEIHVDYENGEQKKQTATHIHKFEYTVVDEQGNWLERKTDSGEVEKRTIKYYAE